MKTHYEVLGVHPTAEPLVIEAAYKALLKNYHPDVAAGDKGAAEEKSKLINEAYRVLKDPSLRAAYDKKLGDSWDAGAETSSGGFQDAEPTETASSRKPASKAGGGLASAFYSALAIAVLIAATTSLRLGGASDGNNTNTIDGANATASKDRPVASAATGPNEASPLSAENTIDPSSQVAETLVSGQRARPIDPSGPSFDCSRVTAPTLKIICSDSDLAVADAQMAQLYRSFLMNSDAPDDLREDQRQWLRKRDALSPDSTVLLSFYRARIQTLREAMPPSLY